ncbi:MAG: hypothetical protein QOD63_2030 [Actinomycetota bacterium]|nr:hypothetical protein [Actinomycetota bacterium]
MIVDAGPVARAYRVAGGAIRTVAVHGSAGRVEVGGPEVAVVVSGRRFVDGESDGLGLVGEPEHAPDRSRLAWRLASPGGEVRVDVEVVADRDAGVVRKRLAVSGTGRLERAELELWDGVAVDGFTSVQPGPPPNTGSVELGQPVFGPGFFGGIEHPGAENLATPRGCSCTLPYDDDLGPRPLVTPSSVIGTGDFFDYLDTIRAHPDRLVVLTNNWYHLGWPGTMSEETVVEELRGYADLRARHDLQLDAYCLDDGWDGAWVPESGLWGRLDPSAFPGGLAALDAAAPASATRIGLWIGPFGGYGDRQVARVAWARERGDEVERFEGDPGFDLLCVAGDRYGAALGRALEEWTAAGVGYWKLDGVRFACAVAGHGHPTGPGGRTAQMDRFARAMGRARRADPGVVVAFTSGSNPSPWWLGSADFLWRGGLDDSGAGFPGPRHESFATYIDARLQLLRRCAVPVSALVTFSVVESEACRYRDAGEDIADWERHCWLMVGRGTQHHDLYVSPGSLSEEEWAALSTALAWARRHRRVLGRSRMVLGDPGRGEVYGFASRRDGEGVLCLRNPTPRRRRVRFTLAGVLGFPDDAAIELEAVHGPLPAGPGSGFDSARRLTVTLEPFGVALFRASTPGSATPPGPRPG